MANTFKNSKLNTVHANSQSATTGEITSTDVSSDSDLSVTIADTETDPDGATYFTVSRLEGTLVIDDYDFGFVDTMNNTNTIETDMANRSKIYVQIDLEDGTLQDSGGSTWFQVRPVLMPSFGVGTDDNLVKTQLEFTHSDHGGVQRPG